MNQPDIEAVFVDALQNIAEGVTELVGFEVAAISIARDDHHLEMVAVAGSDEARAQLLGHRTPIAEIERELVSAEEWGDLRFVPHERMSTDIDELGWVPDLEESDDPDAWHPLDLLMAPIYDRQGRMRGLMSVDVPHDRRRPGPAQREHLERYVRQTRRSVMTALERAELAEQLRLADTARRIVRAMSPELSVPRVVEICQPAVTAGFQASGMWLQTFGPDDSTADLVFDATAQEADVPVELKTLARTVAGRLWDAQDVAVVSPDGSQVLERLGATTEQVERAREHLVTALAAQSILFVPLGAGPECLGCLSLSRPSSTDWSFVERRAALEIGHDLGRALANARTFERERLLLEEQRELAGYRRRLVNTIAHELKNPLTSILGHLDVIGLESRGKTPLDGQLAASTAAIGRAAQRMRALVDDLLVLARVADPDAVLEAREVDLCAVVHDVLDLLRVSIEQGSLSVQLDLPRTPMTAWGDPHELFRLCTNLVSNAVKYTPAHGTITIRLASDPRGVRLTVADTGIGISAADQQRLFQEFFRSTNQAALAVPGTGLGLSIVHRIVERHRGEITVDSALGAGTTFDVRLPAAP